jgi:mannose-6-phosphate isomerase-like protein (cupin superfamily)
MSNVLRKFLLSVSLSAMLPLATAQAKPSGVVTSEADVMKVAHKLEAQLRAKADRSGVLEEALSDGTRVAVRLVSGRAEFHQNAADVFVVLSGEATLVSGGTIVNPQGSEEIRGDSITNGKSATMRKGDVVYVPPATAHQVLLRPGTSFLYLLVKVPRKN